MIFNLKVNEREGGDVSRRDAPSDRRGLLFVYGGMPEILSLARTNGASSLRGY
jgi:hypothetical protein